MLMCTRCAYVCCWFSTDLYIPSALMAAYLYITKDLHTSWRRCSRKAVHHAFTMTERKRARLRGRRPCKNQAVCLKYVYMHWMFEMQKKKQTKPMPNQIAKQFCIPLNHLEKENISENNVLDAIGFCLSYCMSLCLFFTAMVFFFSCGGRHRARCGVF